MSFIRNNHVFKGHRTFLGVRYVTYAEVELPLRYEIFSESKTSFDWGNKSSASRQLAFSMLYQLSDEEFARDNYINFTTEVIQTLNPKDWLLKATDVLEWIDKNRKVINQTQKPQEQHVLKIEPTIVKKERVVVDEKEPLQKQKPKSKPKPKSNVVKEICNKLDISQKELAAILEIPEGTVSSWAVKNEIPRLGKKALEFYIENQKNKSIIDSYKSFVKLLNIA